MVYSGKVKERRFFFVVMIEFAMVMFRPEYEYLISSCYTAAASVFLKSKTQDINVDVPVENERDKISNCCVYKTEYLA